MSGAGQRMLHQAADPAVRAELGDRERDHDDDQHRQDAASEAAGENAKDKSG